MADQRPIGYWLTLVERLVDERFAVTLEEHGVTRRQWQLLQQLQRGPSALADLDRALAPFLRAPTAEDPAGESAAEQLAELLESGWVVVESELYALTERGGVATARLEEVVAEQRSAATAGVGEREYAVTVATLRTIAGNLGAAESS
ncbi:MarR family transcriptional regulator [Rathayibacter sp. SD072]|uniref:MarR family transcriptional regulator n=1 Tax=Rathayibacter sp. SD072 TaxID=2781731 RepID=UPI001A96D9D3|nr:MarR family transcriptional regulator [Rathayibacter sp. SD072]MBO0983048.1 MarR family transcriptional regulator [Rathayibacter sp. SD072]